MTARLHLETKRFEHTVVFFTLLLAKQIANIAHYQSGSANYWLIIMYPVLLIPVVTLPFKREFKVVWIVALACDALAPLGSGVEIRFLGGLFLSIWLASYCWRFLKRGESVQHP